MVRVFFSCCLLLRCVLLVCCIVFCLIITMLFLLGLTVLLLCALFRLMFICVCFHIYFVFGGCLFVFACLPVCSFSLCSDPVVFACV